MALSQFDKERQRQMAINQTQAFIKQGIAAPVIPVVAPKPQLRPTDRRGLELKVGQRVARATSQGTLTLCEVTSIIGDRVFLDYSSQSLRYPNRVVVIN